METLHVYSDCQHAWVKVKKTELHRLGIAEKITAYSYQFGEYAYLEEDCDLATYLVAYFGGKLPEDWRSSIKFVEHYSNHSRVRSYSHYTPRLPVSMRQGLLIELEGKKYEVKGKTGKSWVIVSIDTGVNYRLPSKLVCDAIEVK